MFRRIPLNVNNRSLQKVNNDSKLILRSSARYSGKIAWFAVGDVGDAWNVKLMTCDMQAYSIKHESNGISGEWYELMLNCKRPSFHSTNCVLLFVAFLYCPAHFPHTAVSLAVLRLHL